MGEPTKGEMRPIRRKERYTTTEAASILGISASTVVDFMDRGLMPCFRIPGSRWRLITHKQLVNYMSKQPGFGMVLEALEGLPG
jgi:excisionase family DNA binding protein